MDFAKHRPPLRGRKLKIAFVINHAAFFASHRLPIALEALRRGHEVLLITGAAGSESMEKAAEAKIHSHGIPHVRVPFTASGINPLRELRGLGQLIRVMRREKPDIVHCASPKGILYGGIAARLARCRGVVFAVSGMGFAFTSEGGRHVVRSLAAAAYRLLARFAYGHPNKRVIVQNVDDQALLAGARLATPSEIVLIPGSGVDVRRLARLPLEGKSEVVLFVGRMLLDKGVIEFIDAARIVKKSAPGWRFVMAGASDYQNPTSVSRERLVASQSEGIIEWLGLVEDMDPLYASAGIVCLPSYREGMPKVLLEAAAAGCAVVTTDTTGCRDAILPGVTGDLVPPRDAQALASALLRLIEDRARRERYGIEGRKLAGDRFDVGDVVERILDLYDCLQNPVAD